jgi:hypothetical protein
MPVLLVLLVLSLVPVMLAQVPVPVLVLVQYCTGSLISSLVEPLASRQQCPSIRLLLVIPVVAVAAVVLLLVLVQVLPVVQRDAALLVEVVLWGCCLYSTAGACSEGAGLPGERCFDGDVCHQIT